MAVEETARQAKHDAAERVADEQAWKLQRALECDIAEEKAIKARARRKAAEARRQAALSLTALAESTLEDIRAGVGPNATWMTQLSSRLFPRGLETVERIPGETSEQGVRNSANGGTAGGHWLAQLSNRLFAGDGGAAAAERSTELAPPLKANCYEWFPRTPTITEASSAASDVDWERDESTKWRNSSRGPQSASKGGGRTPPRHKSLAGLPSGGITPDFEFGQVSQRGLMSIRRAEKQLQLDKETQDPRNTWLLEVSGQRRLKLRETPLHEVSGTSTSRSSPTSGLSGYSA